MLSERPNSPITALTDPTQALAAFLPDDAAFRAGVEERRHGSVQNEVAAANRIRNNIPVAEVEAVLLDHVVIGVTFTNDLLIDLDGAVLTTAWGTDLTVGVGDSPKSLLFGEGMVAARIDPGRVDVNLGRAQIAHVIDRLILTG